MINNASEVEATVRRSRQKENFLMAEVLACGDLQNCHLILVKDIFLITFLSGFSILWLKEEFVL